MSSSSMRKGKRGEASSTVSTASTAIPMVADRNMESFSDSETRQNHYRSSYYQLASSLPNMKYSALANRANQDGNYTDDDQDRYDADTPFYHEFADSSQLTGYGNKLVRSGRQRKKLAARTKGGEFQTKRKKRRVYFCCISSEIDVQKLLDYLHGADDLLYDWKFELYNDVLHMYKAGADDATTSTTAAVGLSATANIPINSNTNNSNNNNNNSKNNDPDGKDDFEKALTPRMYSMMELAYNPALQPGKAASNANKDSNSAANTSTTGSDPISLENYLKSKIENTKNHTKSATIIPSLDDTIYRQDSSGALMDHDKQLSRLAGIGSKEVFVFDFGAIVFWGFARGEEAGLLKTIRMFVTKGMVGSIEFQSGEDDMAFVSSPEEKVISIANDVITLPDETEPKQRLAVSFAIAQSSVLAIFEARIEQKVDEYKYIPETLAAVGKVQLSERQLGMMIGEVFVIRHDVNLHTEILDTPDFFWKEKVYEPEYKLFSSYLEMAGRTEILNKRLDMLRELLDVLQQQMENAHAVKLEWIVIYLIVAEVVLQGLAIICK